VATNEFRLYGGHAGAFELSASRRLKTLATVRIDHIEADPVARTVGRPLDSILSD